MSKTIIPANYTPALNLYDTQRAIGTVKRLFADTLCATLNLYRVSAPLFLEASTGLNDDLNGVERKVTFDIRDSGIEAQVVQSLAKWKRKALKDYGFRVGKGLYCDMNAIRRDEELDNLHSVYVDQWDWEKVIREEDRDHIELMTRGSFTKKNGSYYISYKETQTIGFEGCTTTIKIAEDGSRVALLRFGKVNTQLVIQRDYRNICYYETEVGPITLGVTGDGIACDLSEPAGGTAKFSYLLDADDPTALINRTTLEIQVEKVK